MGLHWPDHYWDLSYDFYLLLFWDGFIMRNHGVYLLCCVVELDGTDTLVASGVGLLVFKWSLHVLLFGVVFKNFVLFGRVPGAMQHACIFCTGRSIARMACIVFIALASVALIRVGWQGGSSPPFFPSKTGMIRFFPLSVFERCSSFVDCLRALHVLENIVCLLVGPSFKIPSLYIDLFCPLVGNGVKENLFEFFRFHLFCGD